MIEEERLRAAYEQAQADLLSELLPSGHWIGELATSALSTATAVSALSIVRRYTNRSDVAEALTPLITRGRRWLAKCQREDGGWGDTPDSYSNISTTMLAVAAFHLTGVPTQPVGLLERAEKFIDRHGREKGLRRRYGKDKTFAVPILTNAALAGTVPWERVSPLPFELAVFPQSFYRFLRLPVVSYAIPALVAIGQARFFFCRPRNPLVRLIRRLSVPRSLAVLERMQPASGGYLEAIPLTSFVVMSLAATGRVEHSVVQQGVEFLRSSVREDGSWPIDTNLATWNTSLSVNALGTESMSDTSRSACLQWMLSCQHRQRHPFTGSPPGGWGWSDLSGAVPDADDTPGALLALDRFARDPRTSPLEREQIHEAVRLGAQWLLQLQNRDGGWPTFCRGWGKLPFDRSGTDLTAHVIRAFHAWRQLLDDRRYDLAIERGLAFLERNQQPDGCWIPLWFGNQDHPQELNPVYGTSRVLRMYTDLNLVSSERVKRAVDGLLALQNLDGGWGGRREELEPGEARVRSSIEETSLATDALLRVAGTFPAAAAAADHGTVWLLDEVLAGRHADASPIGFYFAKLWYHERLYPLVFAATALKTAFELRCRSSEFATAENRSS